MQAQTTLISNTGQTADRGNLIVEQFEQATAFTTGSNTTGYTLSEVGVRVFAVNAGAGVQVSIYNTDASGLPSSSLHSLSNPASFTANAVNTFTAAAGATLAANTTYAVVLQNSTSLNWFAGRTTSDSEDAGGATGWSIANQRAWNDTENTNGWSAATDYRLMISIKGTVKGTPANPTITITGGSAVTEGTAAGFTLTASPAPSANKTVNLTVSEAAGSDFVATGDQGAKTVTISSGSTTASYSVTTQNDASVEPTGAVTVTVGTGTGYTVGAPSSASVTVYDNDKALVSNLEQSTAGTSPLNLATYDSAQGFTTGSNTNGYILTSVELPFSSAPSTLTVKIATGLPSATTDVATLSNPSFATGNLTFTAPSGTRLAAGTTYYVVVEGSGAVTSTLSTSEDSGGEPGWSVENFGYFRSASSIGPWSAELVRRIRVYGAAATSDDPSRTAPPGGTTGGAEQGPRNPLPLQLALWTDRLGYRAGDAVRLYRTLDPHDDRGLYRTFIYLERAEGGDRRYLAPQAAADELHLEPVDHRGMPAELAPARTLAAADRSLSFEGEAPEPGLWQFVMELRPGVQEDQFEESEEPIGTRRAWAKFTVAERSLLLNRRGFDREIRDDLTLRSDTIHYLGHQLFVRDGATLTIEPGTLVQAWGRNAAIIVEPGGRIVAEGTREAPVVLTCSAPAGHRSPGCWGGLRLLGRAPSTRPEAVAPGVLPPERAAYGGSAGEDSSGALRYVRVEFAGAGSEPEAAAPAVGLYGVGSGTVLDHVQARASLGDGFAFHGGSAVCDHCVASGSGNAGLAWQRGWRGGASHLYVQQGPEGLHGIDGGSDEDGPDREPRSLPTLSNVTLVHSWPYGRRARRADGVLLRSGSGLRARDLLVTGFGGGAIKAGSRAMLLFEDGESSVSGALLYLNGRGQVRGGIDVAVESVNSDPRLRDVRWFANPDPRPKPSSPALPDEGDGYIGAFGPTENWLEGWTVFGPESVYDLRQRVEEDD